MSTALEHQSLAAAEKDHITVCICTYQRPELLRQLLQALPGQRTEGLFDFSVVVVDNDEKESAREEVAQFAKANSVEAKYFAEPERNIALARNRAVNNAKGNLLAFIDDDEVPPEDWLLLLVKALKAHRVQGVLAPVLPRFEMDPPRWVEKAKFYERPRHKTGFVMSWQESRTGNVLLESGILKGSEPVFRPEFGTGGEDQDFFRRMIERGHVFIWCDEAAVYEVVPRHRWGKRFLLKRALLRGKTTFRHPRDRVRNIAKSLVAVPSYTLALPFLLLLGQHHFMRYLVRLFDHLGRLLALVNLNPIKERCN